MRGEFTLNFDLFTLGNFRHGSYHGGQTLFCFEFKHRVAVFWIFIYYSVGSEADTLRIIRHALESGKRVALPKCTDRNGTMDFYFIDDIESSLTEGMFSLKEPDTLRCEKADSTVSSLCIVPALAADKSGYRLGYGGGYYDRYLSNFKGVTAVLCYEECLCDELPRDKYDISLNMIITESKIIELK